jgi:hypothetical protein
MARVGQLQKYTEVLLPGVSEASCRLSLPFPSLMLSLSVFIIFKLQSLRVAGSCLRMAFWRELATHRRQVRTQDWGVRDCVSFFNIELSEDIEDDNETWKYGRLGYL